MKTRLEKLMQEAGERLKQLEQQTDELNSSISKLESKRANLHAKITHGYTHSDNKMNLSEVVDEIQTMKDQLACNRDYLMDQRKYVATLADKYMELLKLENSTPAQEKNYSSDAFDARFFPQRRSGAPSSYHDEPSVTARHDYS